MGRIYFRSIREGNYLGIVMVFADGSERVVAWMEVPSRNGVDWRADVDTYDEFVKI